MNRLQESLSPQRKRQKVSEYESLTNEERELYNLIKSRENTGIPKYDMRRETNFPTTVVNKSINLLLSKKLIKEITTIQNRGRKNYMASEFEPSKDITGGTWYNEGKLDIDFIKAVKQVCKKCISNQKVSTCYEVWEWCKKTAIFPAEMNEEQIEEILKILVLEDEITEMTSTGYGDFASIPVGKTCYIIKIKAKVKGKEKSGDLTHFPCFSCQRMSSCSPDGLISPNACEYYKKWLDF